MIKRSAVCVMAFLGIGCGLEVPEDVGNDSTAESPIRDAVGIDGSGGAVEVELTNSAGFTFGFCSGVAVSPYIVLTAAHCVPQSTLAGASVIVNARINATENGTTWRCSTGGSVESDGRCALPRMMQVRTISSHTFANPPTGPSPENDIAVVFSNTRLANIGWYRNLSTNVRSGDTGEFWGRGVSTDSGAGQGTMRYTYGVIDWVGSQHFFADGMLGSSGICRGDSGGAVIQVSRSDATFGTLMGILSKAQIDDGRMCSRGEARVRVHRIAMRSIDLLNSVIRTMTPNQGLCWNYDANVWTCH